MLLNTKTSFILNIFATDSLLAMDTHINYCKLAEWILSAILMQSAIILLAQF